MTQDVPEQQSQERQEESAAQASVPEPKSAEVPQSPIQEPGAAEVPLSPSPETPAPEPAAAEPVPAAASVEPQPQEPPPQPLPQSLPSSGEGGKGEWEPEKGRSEDLKTKALSLLPLALERRRAKRAKKLERILDFAKQHGRVANDEVQKLVGVSDRTAQRYLKDLEHQGKLKAVILGGNLTHYILP